MPGSKTIIRIIIWLVMLIGGAIVGIMIDRSLFPALFGSLLLHTLSFIAGVILSLFVINGAKNTGRNLARAGRVGNLPRMETNRLVTTGFYSCMRHPMHFVLLFFPLTLALIIGSPTFIFMIWPAEALLMILMIRYLEEPEAEEKFGDDYRAYKKEVPMFSLSISTLRQLFSKKPDMSQLKI
ncbi:MAG: isoprenylcysteine carboxylmethyltransferase family protein [Desulfocapsa sp.]|nr:isoprenylcysteine carboxylmethyltransferase family protein [Desulfocapsa sp.]